MTSRTGGRRAQLRSEIARTEAIVARLTTCARRDAYDRVVAIGALVLTALCGDDWPYYVGWLADRDLDTSERVALSRSASGTAVSRATRLLWAGGSWVRRRAQEADADALREWLATHGVPDVCDDVSD